MDRRPNLELLLVAFEVLIDCKVFIKDQTIWEVGLDNMDDDYVELLWLGFEAGIEELGRTGKFDHDWLPRECNAIPNNAVAVDRGKPTLH